MRTNSCSSTWRASSAAPEARLEALRAWLTASDVYLADRPLPFADTRAVTIRLNADGAFGIFLDRARLPCRRDEYSVLLHESGHVATGATHAVSSPFDLVQKHEYSADKWAAQAAVTADELDEAVAAGHTELWDLAEHFGVSEALMRKIVCLYTYGNVSSELYF